MEVKPIVHRARSVGVTVTMDVNALVFIDKYAEEQKLSRSMAMTELLRLSRAYLKVLDAQKAVEGDVSVETPSLLIEKTPISAIAAEKALIRKGQEMLTAPKKHKKKK